MDDGQQNWDERSKAMTEHESEQSIQEQPPAQSDTRITAAEPPKQFPPLQWKRKWWDGATLLLLFCAFVGALVGFVGTQFEVVETSWSVPGRGTGMYRSLPQSGKDITIEVRHWGLLIATPAAHVTQSYHPECMPEETNLVYTAWSHRLAFIFLWAVAGTSFGWWIGRKW
jgi:hypothetical protein